MEKVLLGKTGLEVSRLGIGLSEIGSSDEETSKKILNTLIEKRIKDYGTARDYPSVEGTSKLSPYIKHCLIKVSTNSVSYTHLTLPTSDLV